MIESTGTLGAMLGALYQGLVYQKVPSEVAGFLCEAYLSHFLDRIAGDPERRFLDHLGGGGPE